MHALLVDTVWPTGYASLHLRNLVVHIKLSLKRKDLPLPFPDLKMCLQEKFPLPSEKIII